MELVAREGKIICGVATPLGVGGISVVRLSGENSLESLKKVCPFLPERAETHRVYVGNFRSYQKREVVDQVVVTFFAKGKSFTGEEVCEISCHGNPKICEEILQELVGLGALIALPGEFTFRAFINGKIDLTQAEGLRSLIEAQSKSAMRLGLSQLGGSLSKSIAQVIDDLTWCLAHMEASIDFSTEGLATISDELLLQKLSGICESLETMVAGYRAGRLLKDGLRIGLLGEPNVGKSSLLNLFVEEDRAIVTPVPGTTRDIVDSEVVHDGQKLIFLDTAGIRSDTPDPVEALGIRRSLDAVTQVDLALLVIDLSQGEGQWAWLESLDLKNTQIAVLGTKSDLCNDPEKKLEDACNRLEKFFGFGLKAFGPLNHRSTSDRSRVMSELVSLFGLNRPQEGVLISQLRHYEAILVAVERIRGAIFEMRGGLGAEFVALPLKEALVRLQSILGVYFDDQILDRVFREFCLGK